MDTDLGRNLVLWTVRASVAFYVIAGWRYLFAIRERSSADSVYLMTWSASWLLCVVHVICAFHFEHHWSHTAALKHTADMTARVVGIHWGGGLYINFLFLAWWGSDVVCHLIDPLRVSSNIMHITAAFMMFNATAVFGPKWWWIPVVGIIAAVMWKYWVRDRERTKCHSVE